MERQRSFPNSCRKARSQRKSCPSFKVVDHSSIKHTKNGFFHKQMYDIFSLFTLFKQMETTPSIYDRMETNLHAGPSTFSNSILVKCKNDSWLSPGNLVWAKKDNNAWWPAEILDATSLLKCTGSYSIGRNLVKFFGDDALAWLDPVREISEFHAFYEERCKNSSVFFQDALDEALQKHFNSSTEISPSKSISSQNTESSPSENTDEENSSNVSGKRKRKIKLHFDDLTVSEKPVKIIRRIKIMRHLGLMPPAGSPFLLRNN